MNIDGFEIEKKLGDGTTGAVYKAVQKSMNRVVALKVLSLELSKDEKFQKRFISEARTCARLAHRNIIQAIDVGQTSDGIFYFVMEYIDGVTVWHLLRKKKVIEEEKTINIILQIAKALQHTHSHNFIHRDIKPENIMITKNGVAKLCDLGLARKSGAEVEAMTGTPYYISPEQIQGENVDIRSDIYSLGATAYHMATGKVPFGGTPTVVMSKHLTKSIPPLNQINPSLSDNFCRVVTNMLAKNPKDRYWPDELIEELKPFVFSDEGQEAANKIVKGRLSRRRRKFR